MLFVLVLFRRILILFTSLFLKPFLFYDNIQLTLSYAEKKIIKKINSKKCLGLLCNACFPSLYNLDLYLYNLDIFMNYLK